MSTSLDTQKLAEMIRTKRGDLGLRAAAIEIGGVSASTLSRIEQGNVPDIDTFLNLCKWLEVSPEFFTKSPNGEKADTKKQVIAHLRADRTLPENTTKALIQMITLAFDSISNGDIQLEKNA